MNAYRTIGATMLLLAFGVAQAASLTPRNPQELIDQVNDLASDVKKLLEEKGTDSIAIGQFTGPSRIPSSYGPGLARVLGDQLKKQNIRVSNKAAFEIKGDYLAIEDAKSKQPIARIKARVYDRSGSALLEFSKDLASIEALGELFGLTLQPEVKPWSPENSKKVKESIDNPKVHVERSRVLAGPNSPFGMEVLVKNGDRYVPRLPEDQDGLAFVPIKRGEAYAVRLINNSPYEMAIFLNIDGLNVFTFSENPIFSKFIVQPRSSVLVKGWHRTNEYSDEFEITEYAKSAAAEVGNTAGVGTITARFAASWKEGAQPPPDEREETLGGFLGAAPPDATGRGKQVEQKYTGVQREIGKTRAIVSIRYVK